MRISATNLIECIVIRRTTVDDVISVIEDWETC